MKTDLRPARPEKVAVVDEVRANLAASSATILTEYRGLGVADMAELRRSLAAVGGRYKVYKNTLVRRAAAESGLGALEPLLEGPTAVAFVEGDVAAVAKVLRDFARTHPNLIVKGGLVGTSLLDAKSTTALAELPSREVLLSQIAGALAAPMQQFASLLKAVPQKFAYGLSALLEKRGGAPVVDEAPTAGETEEVAADGSDVVSEDSAAHDAAADDVTVTEPEPEVAAATDPEPEPEVAAATDPEPEVAAATDPEPEPEVTATEPDEAG